VSTSTALTEDVEYYDDDVEEDSVTQTVTTTTTVKTTTAIVTDDIEYYDDEEDEATGGKQIPKELLDPDGKSEINIHMSSLYFVMILMLINQLAYSSSFPWYICQ
jgi:hypothetical protein